MTRESQSDSIIVPGSQVQLHRQSSSLFLNTTHSDTGDYVDSDHEVDFKGSHPTTIGEPLIEESQELDKLNEEKDVKSIKRKRPATQHTSAGSISKGGNQNFRALKLKSKSKGSGGSFQKFNKFSKRNWPTKRPSYSALTQPKSIPDMDFENGMNLVAEESLELSKERNTSAEINSNFIVTNEMEQESDSICQISTDDGEMKTIDMLIVAHHLNLDLNETRMKCVESVLKNNWTILKTLSFKEIQSCLDILTYILKGIHKTGITVILSSSIASLQGKFLIKMKNIITFRTNQVLS